MDLKKKNGNTHLCRIFAKYIIKVVPFRWFGHSTGRRGIDFGHIYATIQFIHFHNICTARIDFGQIHRSNTYHHSNVFNFTIVFFQIVLAVTFVNWILVVLQERKWTREKRDAYIFHVHPKFIDRKQRRRQQQQPIDALFKNIKTKLYNFVPELTPKVHSNWLDKTLTGMPSTWILVYIGQSFWLFLINWLTERMRRATSTKIVYCVQ